MPVLVAMLFIGIVIGFFLNRKLLSPYDAPEKKKTRVIDSDESDLEGESGDDEPDLTRT